MMVIVITTTNNRIIRLLEKMLEPLAQTVSGKKEKALKRLRFKAFLGAAGRI